MLVANEWRSVWGVTCFWIPARVRASTTAPQTTLGVMGTSARQPFNSPGNRYVRGFIHRQYSRKTSRSFALRRTSRSRAPVPWRTRITIRSLSMSATFSWHISERRNPVAYRVMSMARCIRFLADAISFWTSSGLRTVGRTLGRLGNGICSWRYGRFSVFTYRKRRAAVRTRTVWAKSLRSRNR